jgi:UDP-N-acetylglucosamine 4,6-dehydratase
VVGAKNVIEAALENQVKKIIAISSDKAVNPINLYGATKLLAEKLFVQANAYSGKEKIKFSCVRYGNVVGSRGSVIPLFINQRKNGVLTVTHKEMTRFWITIEQGVKFVIKCIENMQGGEIFVPKIPSTRIMDLVKLVAPSAKVKYIGVRPGEKIHEVLISEDESRQTLEFADMFIIQPHHKWWSAKYFSHGRSLAEGFRYTSNNNPQQLSSKQLQKMIQELNIL